MLVYDVLFISLLILCSFLIIHIKSEPRILRKTKKERFCFKCKLKPEWVKREILRIKAHVPNAGCRQIADIFNRKFYAEKEISVGKTYVSMLLRKHIAEVLEIRKRWKHRIPRAVPNNLVWGIDLTGITDNERKSNMLLGIIDNGSRKCISLQALKNKASITLVRKLLDAIEQYGKPKVVKTDNESVFTSRIFRWCIAILGIRHQRTMLHCPWQNGRIERFFGTFKCFADKVIFNAKYLQSSLDEFTFWYNSVRPHRNLDGRTPDEAWNGINPYAQPPKSCRKFSAWGGLLRGFRMEYG